MENLIKRTASLKTGLKAAIILGSISLIAGAIVALGGVFLSMRIVNNARSEVYVLDKGTASTARRVDGSSERSLEVRDHLVRFHEYLFNLSPTKESIESSIDRALGMSDRSVLNYYRSQSEKGFYNRLIQENVLEQFALDSLFTNCRAYPYEAVVYGKLFLIRQTNIQAYHVCTTCQLVDITRSPENPHGLMIEKFAISRIEDLGERKRQ